MANLIENNKAIAKNFLGNVVCRDASMKIMTRFTPVSILFMAAIFAIMWSGTVIWVSFNQPYMGLKLGIAGEQIRILDTDSSLTGTMEIPENQVLKRISTPTQAIDLIPMDLAPEPDSAMGTYRNYAQFLERQGQIADMLQQQKLELTFGDGQVYSISVMPHRPVKTFDLAFWVQLIVGVVAWLISAAVYAFRSNELAARYLLLSGVCTLIFSSFAGIYSTREIALPTTLFQFLSDLNFFGGSVFIASFVALLLYYPRRIAPNWVGVGVIGIFVFWFIAQQMGMFESMTFARRFLVMLGLICSFVLAAIHWWFSQYAPLERAALQWFLLSWLLGTSLFVLFILLPTLFGFDTSALQGYAFTLFLLVYIGLAFGILRYRLFELGIWWGRILLLLIAILFLILLDIIFISLLNLSPKISMTLTLVVCGILWLPLRGWIWERFLGYLSPKRELQFREIIGVTLATAQQNQQQLWQEVLQKNFAALHVEEGIYTEAPVLAQQGLQLHIPAIQQLDAVTLGYAGQGRRLFSQYDVAIAIELCEMLDYAIQAKMAYEAGVIEERQRIRRDLHDNISSQLVNALHSQQPQRKDDMIRNTLTDLRDVINHSMSGGICFEELLINIRAEIAERLALADIQLDWSMTGNVQQAMSLEMIHGLRSILREATNNCIRHAHAQHLKIKIRIETQFLLLQVQDDGQGLAELKIGQGQGLTNMQTRVQLLGGEIQFLNQQGLFIDMKLPLGPNRE